MNTAASARLAAASDAAADCPADPSGGFLLAFLPGPKLAGVSIIDNDLKAVLIPSKQQIAQWELMQVLTALLAYPEWFRGRAGVWWINNVPALIALVKGKSGADDMDRTTMMIHLLMYTLQCDIYFEYVPSDSNWADGISRPGNAMSGTSAMAS